MKEKATGTLRVFACTPSTLWSPLLQPGVQLAVSFVATWKSSSGQQSVCLTGCGTLRHVSDLPSQEAPYLLWPPGRLAGGHFGTSFLFAQHPPCASSRNCPSSAVPPRRPLSWVSTVQLRVWIWLKCWRLETEAEPYFCESPGSKVPHSLWCLLRYINSEDFSFEQAIPCFQLNDTYFFSY